MRLKTNVSNFYIIDDKIFIKELFTNNKFQYYTNHSNEILRLLSDNNTNISETFNISKNYNMYKTKFLNVKKTDKQKQLKDKTIRTLKERLYEIYIIIDGLEKIITSKVESGIFNMCSFNYSIGEIAEKAADILNADIRKLKNTQTYNFCMNNNKFQLRPPQVMSGYACFTLSKEILYLLDKFPSLIRTRISASSGCKPSRILINITSLRIEDKESLPPFTKL